jgi:hypothetical protein
MGRLIIGKFGRDVRRNERDALEAEIVRERASALGRAGRKLEASLERYRLLIASKPTPEELGRLLDEVAQNLWYTSPVGHVEDFHLQVRRPAGRTKRKSPRPQAGGTCL